MNRQLNGLADHRRGSCHQPAQPSGAAVPLARTTSSRPGTHLLSLRLDRYERLRHLR